MSGPNSLLLTLSSFQKSHHPLELWTVVADRKGDLALRAHLSARPSGESFAEIQRRARGRVQPQPPLAGAALDRCDPGSTGRHSHPLGSREIFNLWWCRPVAVGHFFEQSGEAFLVVTGRKALVEAQAQQRLGKVSLRQLEIHPQPQFHLSMDSRWTALELCHRLLEELAVGLETNRFEKAVLLSAKQVAGAADLEVEVREAEAEVPENMQRRGVQTVRHARAAGRAGRDRNDQRG